MMQVLVYKATFKRGGRWLKYSGATEVRGTERESLLARRKSHKQPPAGAKKVAWLQGLDLSTLQLVQAGKLQPELIEHLVRGLTACLSWATVRDTEVAGTSAAIARRTVAAWLAGAQADSTPQDLRRVAPRRCERRRRGAVAAGADFNRVAIGRCVPGLQTTPPIAMQSIKKYMGGEQCIQICQRRQSAAPPSPLNEYKAEQLSSLSVR